MWLLDPLIKLRLADNLDKIVVISHHLVSGVLHGDCNAFFRVGFLCMNGVLNSLTLFFHHVSQGEKCCKKMENMQIIKDDNGNSSLGGEGGNELGGLRITLAGLNLHQGSAKFIS